MVREVGEGPDRTGGDRDIHKGRHSGDGRHDRLVARAARQRHGGHSSDEECPRPPGTLKKRSGYQKSSSMIASATHWPWRVSHTRRSEEHTSELQSLRHLVCRLLLEKKKKKK